MTRKQFFILILALLVLGGAGLYLFRQDSAAYRASGAKIGAPLLPGFRIAEVAQVRLQDGKHTTTLAREDKGWVVRERGGYPASFQNISDLLLKLAELKVTQSEQIGASLLPRVDLAEPGKGEGSGLLVEFADPQGKQLARLVLGKIVKKKDPLNPLPSAVDGVPAGRYILPAAGSSNVVVVSDPLSKATAEPGKWLERDFFKAERIRTLSVEPAAGAGWKITRDEEWGQWKFVGGGGDLSPSRAVSAVNALSSMSFEDVLREAGGAEAGKSAVAVAETFDGLTYRVQMAPRKSGEDYLVSVAVTGEPAQARVPEKDEKAEEKARRDKDFAENRKRLVERVAREQAMAKWTYVVAKKDLEPILKDRSELIAQKNDRGGR